MNESSNRSSQLSARQIACLQGKAEGKKNKVLAVALGVSESTVAKELYAAYCVMGVSSAAAAVAIGISQGWLGLPLGRGVESEPPESVPA